AILLAGSSVMINWNDSGISTAPAAPCLAAAGLTPEQQKAPLESALREYKLALSNAQYLLSRNMPAVDSSQLEAYIVELNIL
ncbi:hypothetical protein KC221_28980, partial [Mycobacterium tuberculosis]|nr:hypothetical protein [Mycobacterium tuberculosis]